MPRVSGTSTHHRKGGVNHGKLRNDTGQKLKDKDEMGHMETVSPRGMGKHHDGRQEKKRGIRGRRKDRFEWEMGNAQRT